MYLIIGKNDDFTQVDGRGTAELLCTDGSPSVTFGVLMFHFLVHTTSAHDCLLSLAEHT